MAAEAKIEITASTSRLPAGLRAAMKAVQGFVAETTGMFGKQKKDLDERAMARGAAWGGIASNLAMRGFDVLVGQAKEVMTFERELMRLGIASRISGAELRKVAGAAREISSATGKSALEVLRGGRAYSDLAGAQNFSIDMMRVMARSAQATGAETSHLAGTMFQLNESMGIKDAATMERVMGGLANQAKDGAIEFAQMSSEFGGMMPLFKRFGLTGVEGTMRLGAMYQVVRKGANSAAEAGTMMQRILGGIPSHASKFRKYGGFDVFNTAKDGTKTYKTFAEVQKLVMNSPLVKDPELFKKSLGRTEGWQGFTLIIEQMQEVERLYNLGMSGGNVISQDLATATESSSIRIDIAMERIKNAVADAFTPERIEAFVTAIEDSIEKVMALVSLVGKVGGVLGKFYEAGKGIRAAISDPVGDVALGNPWADESGAEEMVRKGFWQEGGVDPAVQRAAELVRSRRAGYHTTAKELIRLSDGDKPTLAGAKRALHAQQAKGDASWGEIAAGNKYLKHVPPDMLKEATAALAEENLSPSQRRARDATSRLATEGLGGPQSLAPFAGPLARTALDIAQDRYDASHGTPDEDPEAKYARIMAESAASTQRMLEAQQKNQGAALEVLLKKLAADIVAGIKGTEISLDGNKVLGGVQNATGVRRGTGRL